MPNYGGESSGGSDLGGGNYSGGGGGGYGGSGGGNDDWAGINQDIAQALGGIGTFSPATGGYVATAPNVGNTQAINWQSHVGPDPGSYNDAGAAMGFQNNIGSMMGPGGNKIGFDRGKARTAMGLASSIFGPVLGAMIGGLTGLLTGTDYGGYLKANPDGSVGLTTEIPGQSFDDGSESFSGGNGTGGEGELSDGFSGYGGVSGGPASVAGESREEGYAPQTTGPTRADIERYAYKNVFADDDLARSLVFGEGEFTKSLF